MKVIKRKIEFKVAEEVSKRYAKFMTGHPDYRENLIPKYSTLENKTIPARLGSIDYEIDVKLCSGDDGDALWTECVLFRDGVEECCSEVSDSLLGPWGLVVDSDDEKFRYELTICGKIQPAKKTSTEIIADYVCKVLRDAAKAENRPVTGVVEVAMQDIHYLAIPETAVFRGDIEEMQTICFVFLKTKFDRVTRRAQFRLENNFEKNFGVKLVLIDNKLRCFGGGRFDFSEHIDMNHTIGFTILNGKRKNIQSYRYSEYSNPDFADRDNGSVIYKKLCALYGGNYPAYKDHEYERFVRDYEKVYGEGSFKELKLNFIRRELDK